MMFQFGFEKYIEHRTLPPPLPRPVRPGVDQKTNPTIVESWLRRFRSGCYELELELYDSRDSRALVPFVGTLRCEVDQHNFLGSGDLYLRSEKQPQQPTIGIPAFPRKHYRYYLRVERLILADHGHEVQICLNSFSYHRGTWWIPDREFQLSLRRVVAPPNYPKAEDYFQGQLCDSYGNEVGRVRLGWVSKMLRKATIEVAGVQGVDLPPESIQISNNGGYISWQSLFATVGWEICLKSDRKLVQGIQPALGGVTWPTDDLNRLLEAHRQHIEDLGTLLDEEWRYFLFCVPLLGSSSYRGLMFDTGLYDGNEFPREGAAIAAQAPFSEVWKDIFPSKCGQRPMLQSEEEVYFRTAVHEIGHAMGLAHQDRHALHRGFMTPLDTVRRMVLSEDQIPTYSYIVKPAQTARAPNSPQTNIARERFFNALHWSFAPQDALRLKHWPDIFIRPGGHPFFRMGFRQKFSPWAKALWPEWNLSAGDEDLQLEAKPLPDCEVLPLGAPARIELMLRNQHSEPIEVSPMELSLGTLEVVVIDPASVEHRIRPLLHVLDGEEATIPLAAGGTIRHSLTLLRGDRGPLFALPGWHRIRATWIGEAAGQNIYRTAACSVLVQFTAGTKRAQLAYQIFDSPQLLHLLVIGGHPNTQLEELIDKVVASQTSLNVHYRWIQLKLHARRDRDLEKLAKELIEKKQFHASTTELRRFLGRSKKLDQIIHEKLASIANDLGDGWALPAPVTEGAPWY